jgi:5-methylcytosine-specific restriction endonuclease McrA
MKACSPAHSLSDDDLLARLEDAVRQERKATAHVVALLMEVDSRKLYARQSCSSLFTYCVKVLHLSEHAAYLRIEAARAARRFPAILDRLADGELHLTAISLLAPLLTTTNHIDVLDAARHKSKREVEQLVARLRPQPDVPAVIRKLPSSKHEVEAVLTSVGFPALLPVEHDVPDPRAAVPSVAALRPLPPAEVKPLAPERFKVQFTVSRATYEKLREAQDLLRHAIPNGDPAAIFDRALTLLLADVSKTKWAATDEPKRGVATSQNSRYLPAAIRREVWRRDGGRCAFRGELGRCEETGFLEFHHLVPYARGGETSVENLELRCRAHNVYEAEQQFGRGSVRLLGT